MVEASRPVAYNARNVEGNIVRRITLTVVVCALACLAASRAVAGDPATGKSGLKLPRFASLRAGEVNVRSGPGMRYPVDWVFLYRNMPVEIVAEFDSWRKVRDWQGAEGWVHRSMLSGRRWAIVQTGLQPLMREPKAGAPMVARIEKKVIGRILECRGAWCRIDFSGFRGWMRRDQFWGVYPDEPVN